MICRRSIELALVEVEWGSGMTRPARGGLAGGGDRAGDLARGTCRTPSRSVPGDSATASFELEPEMQITGRVDGLANRPAGWCSTAAPKDVEGLTVEWTVPRPVGDDTCRRGARSTRGLRHRWRSTMPSTRASPRAAPVQIQAFMAKRRANGKTTREARRCSNGPTAPDLEHFAVTVDGAIAPRGAAGGPCLMIRSSRGGLAGRGDRAPGSPRGTCRTPSRSVPGAWGRPRSVPGRRCRSPGGWPSGNHLTGWSSTAGRVSTGWRSSGRWRPATMQPAVVRLVNSGFGTGAEHDAQYDGMTEGWRLFMFNLRLHLEHFAGQTATAVLPMAMWAGPRRRPGRRSPAGSASQTPPSSANASRSQRPTRPLWPAPSPTSIRAGSP